MTQVEREGDAVAEAPQWPVFDWTNKQWSERWLPVVRLASLSLQADRREAIGAMSETEASDLAEACVDAAEHFEALMRLCTAAADHVATTWDAAHPKSV